MRSVRAAETDPGTDLIRSIAVLPLANLSGDPDQEFFSDGMTEALITDLAKIHAFKVISRTSVMRYKGSSKSLPEIARELGVDAVLEGSVLRAGDEVRITAQLIHAASDTHLWAESYDRRLRDILTLQSKVAHAIVTEVKVKLSPQEEARLTPERSIDPRAPTNTFAAATTGTRSPRKRRRRRWVTSEKRSRSIRRMPGPTPAWQMHT